MYSPLTVDKTPHSSSPPTPKNPTPAKMKGGSGNFGVITRFDVTERVGPDVYAGTGSYDSTEVKGILEYLEAFVTPRGGIDDPALAILPNVFIDPGSGTVTVSAFALKNGNDTSSFDNFTTLKTLTNIAKRRNYDDFIAESVLSGDRSFRHVKY